MDASVQDLDPVKVALGEELPLVKWEDLTAGQRLQLVSAINQKVRPLLKVLPGFKTLQEWLEEKMGPLLSGVTQMFGTLSWETYCRPLLEVSGLVGGELESGVTDRAYLLTDRDGNWMVVAIASQLSYFPTTATPQPRPFRVTRLEVEDDLRLHIAAQRGRQVYQALYEALELAICHWNNRIGDCSEVRDWIGEINSRVV